VTPTRNRIQTLKPTPDLDSGPRTPTLYLDLAPNPKPWLFTPRDLYASLGPGFQMLNVSYNRIRKISRRSFQGLQSVRKIDLRHNRLVSLDQQTFASLRQHDETVCWTSTCRRSRVCGSTTRQSAEPRPADVRESTAADVRTSSSLRRRKSVALQLHF